eukprot:Sdes_comp9390_c0_seq1m851
MCSVEADEEEVYGELNQPEERETAKKENTPPGKDKNVPTQCLKCTGSAQLHVREKESYCKSCFEAYFVHKFRSQLGKSKAIHASDKVLLAFSGGASSRAMLELIREGVSSDSFNRFKFETAVVWIDESVLFPNITTAPGWQEKVEKIAQDAGFPLFCVPLQEIFSHEFRESQISSQFSCPDAENDIKATFLNFLHGVKSSTAKEDILRHIRQKLIHLIAKKHGYNRILFGHSMTRLATLVLSNIAQGRGFTLGLDIGFSDPRHGDILQLRPLRDCSTKEVAFFLNMRGLDSLSIPSISTGQSNLRLFSIEQLTERFLTGLQSEYPFTVSTVYRTADKIYFPGHYLADPRRCVLCDSPYSHSEAQIAVLESSASLSTDLSSLLSIQDADESSEVSLLSSNMLCYACSRNYPKELFSSLKFPPFVEEKVAQRAFKQDISEYLL